VDHTPDPTRSGGPDVPVAQGTPHPRPLTWRDRFPTLAALTSPLPPDGPGLYFLIKAETIIYIGSSDHPSKRVWAHATNSRKDFDHEVFLSVPPPDDLLAAERYWIRTCTPKHNKAWNPCPDPTAIGWGASGTSRMVRVPERMAVQLEVIAVRDETCLADEVKTAVRLYLEKHNLWPPA
jgi:hypothetical protein